MFASTLKNGDTNMSTTVPDPSLTVDEFCAAEKVSRSQLYKDWNRGTGPRFYYNGTRRIISAEARREWRRERESAK
jgi:hypothetical protein